MPTSLQIMHKPLFLALIVVSLTLIFDSGPSGTARGQEESNHETVPCRGVLKLIDSVKLPAERAGVVEQTMVREGVFVQQGDVLASIKSQEQRIQLANTELEYEIARLTAANDVDYRYAQKSLEVSKAELQRSLDSNRRVTNSVPLARIEQQQLEVHRNELQLEQARRDGKVATMKADLAKKKTELAGLMVARSRVTAPIDGMIVAVESKAGEWVEPGQTIFKIVRLNRLKLEGFVSAEDASRIRVGDKVTAKVRQDQLGNHAFNGRVMFKNPEANPVNSTVQIWVEVDNRDLKLTPGLAADMTIQLTGQ